eukprot:5616212-Pyramimonas_sp.AAC.1
MAASARRPNQPLFKEVPSVVPHGLEELVRPQDRVRRPLRTLRRNDDPVNWSAASGPAKYQFQ